ncbi:ABC transporter substrate-binding protein [Ruicaihuangia caeni]|uniref:ABC transporter substrate-binding protein n=1 Tax=Ruicaihuangia caeni TaxID=3042517 RepID=UPI00338F55B4
MHHSPITIRSRRLRGASAAIAGIAALGVALAGCSSTAGPDPDTGDPAAEERGSLTFVAGVKGDPFYITMSCGAQAAAEEAGLSFDFQAPNSFSPTDQIPIVDGVAAAAPSALLIAPTDGAAMFAPIQRVVDAGTNVVLVDTALDDSSTVRSSVRTDDYAGGVEAAKLLAELIGGSGEVLLLNFQAGVSTTEARGKGFVDTAEQLGLTVVGQEYGGTDIEKGAQIVDATLQRHPNLAGVFTTTDYGAQGTVASLRNAGELGSVKVVGFDASPVMVEQLRAGDIQGIVSQQARTIGELGVAQALAAMNGEATESVIEVPTVTIRAEDLESESAKAGLQVERCN